ncbi:MAG: sulfite exporter TauE/SafE family protein [bacterium]
MFELTWLGAVFFIVAVIYSSVGLGGGSTYTAILALTTIPAVRIPPIALTLNIVVAGLALWSFAGENHFKLELAVPLLITSIPASLYGASLVMGNRAVLWILAIALGLASGTLWNRSQLFQVAQFDRNHRIAIGLLTGTALGFLAGVTGIGGGVFLIPVVMLLGWASEKEAAAVGALFVWLNSFAGLSSHLARGNVPLEGLIPLVASVTLGGLIGSQLGAKWIEKSTLRRVVSVLLFVVSLRLVLSLSGVGI